jgi:hypothetical protein
MIARDMLANTADVLTKTPEIPPEYVCEILLGLEYFRKYVYGDTVVTPGAIERIRRCPDRCYRHGTRLGGNLTE